VDFYLPESRLLIQVAQNLDNTATREREVRAINEALHSLKGSRGLILSDSNGQPIVENGLTIDIRSTAEWLLSSSS
jgi:hypothetical protein